MKAYDWEKISLLGHSMGGSISFFFTSLYPKKVDMLISIDAIRRPEIVGTNQLLYWQMGYEKALADNERILLNIDYNEPPVYTYEECENMLYHSTEGSVFKENCKYLLQRNIAKSKKYPDKYYFSRDGRIKLLNDVNANDKMALIMVKRFSKIPVPYLIIKGGKTKNSSNYSDFVEQVLAKYHKNYEIHTVPEGTHHVHLNHAKETADIIIEFLKKNRSVENLRNEIKFDELKAKM